MNPDSTFAQLDEKLRNRYQIIETDSGLRISESRVMLFDVMEAHDAGDSIYEIAQTFNLTPLQVMTAVDYIETHRAALEPEFAKAIQARDEMEAYYRKQNEEVWARIAQAPMTPERAAFYALREKNRREVEEQARANHSQ
ncbi:MAG: hypothetical protein U0350_12870 [Caldilineaceae bacterium]